MERFLEVSKEGGISVSHYRVGGSFKLVKNPCKKGGKYKRCLSAFVCNGKKN